MEKLFRRIKYPDGQISAVATMDLDKMPHRVVNERINSYEDLFFVRSIADIIHFNNDKGWELFIPCLFGQRSDRRFSMVQSFDMKLITDVINQCKFKRIKIFDPHSDVAVGLMKKSVKVSSLDYVRAAVLDILSKKSPNQLTLVSPDGGSYKKVFEYGEQLNLPVVAAVKHRSLDGEISMVFSQPMDNTDALIVDDLCDGGRTFVTLAQELRKHSVNSVYLYVSHGIFSAGFKELYTNLDHIYCTNSIRDLDMGTLLDERKDPSEDIKLKHFVTQYKIT